MILRRILLPVHFNSLFQALLKGINYLYLILTFPWLLGDISLSAFLLCHVGVPTTPRCRVFKIFTFINYSFGFVVPSYFRFNRTGWRPYSIVIRQSCRYCSLDSPPFLFIWETDWVLLFYFCLFPFVHLYISTGFMVCQ